jgi:FkbM family methyltransferase
VPVDSAIPTPGFRERHRALIWALLWPVRMWFSHSPLHRGKGAILRRVILPALPPPPATFDYRFGDNLTVPLFYREGLGMIVLTKGSYETAEIRALCNHAAEGSTAFDVGANIGLSALELSRSVGSGGKVIAFEPHPGTAARLAANIRANAAESIHVEQVAVSEQSGTIVFHESAEPTFSSATVVPRHVVRSFEVPVTTLDEVWRRYGTPVVSVVKVDVEGGELQVLRGAQALLQRDQPAILLEAWGDEQLHPIEALLSRFGYRRTQPAGFEERNFLFVKADAAT